jgi:hypothetical protein
MATNSDLRENSIADLLSELSQESVEPQPWASARSER